MVHRLALITAVATGLLILAGGVVTNTGSGLAVPDWPNTFGYNMFLFPWSKMVGGVLYEHSHRLIGALVGLLTLALGAALWRLGSPLRWLGIAAIGAVVLQGVLGGLRVVLLSPTLAIVHGSLAQAFFALVCVVAWLTSRSARLPRAEIDGSLRRLALVAAALVYLQVVLGAILTHTGVPELHLVGALVVFGLLPVVTARARRSGDPVAVPSAWVILALLGVQLVLGTASFLVRFSSLAVPGGAFTVLALPVAHRLAGSLLLGVTTVLAIRLGGRSPAPAWLPVPTSLAEVRGAAR